MLSSLARWSLCSHVSPCHFKPRSFSSSSSSSSSSFHFSPWSGLQAWRRSPLNENRDWGPNGPEPQLLSTLSAADEEHDARIGEASSLAELGSLVLSTSDPLIKSRLSHLAYSRWRRENLPLGQFTPPTRPARPEQPKLRLAELGFKYGDMPAHNLLWRQCEKSSDNVAARLAIIPLVQEARGLDAGPRLVQKLVGFGDNRTSKIVARIADEEVAHVAVGVYWFVDVCQKLDCPPGSTFKDLLKEYNVELKGPFNFSARDEAGIPRDWYDPSSSGSFDKRDTNDQKKQLHAVRERLASIIDLEGENYRLTR